jgi:GTP pyrophosphokinase
VLYPEKFEEIMLYLTKQFHDWSKFLDKWIKNLTDILKKEWIEDFKVLWRIKSPFRIFEKMNKKYHTEDVSRIMDLLAFRVVTETITDCYMILWIIHKYYTPLIKKIKDYIAIPKFNWYKSIHTTILWMFRFPVEIQIRTKKMDEVAEFWVAAHFAYAESNASVIAPSQQWQWIQRLQQIVADYKWAEDKEKFKDALNIEILDKTIFVYTPKWDIKELPAWSSVLDFAFSIHSEIWLRFKNAIVNGQIRPLSYIVKTWDIIKINTFKNRYSAVKHWIDYLHTPSARGQLIKYIRTQEREARLDEAIDGLNQYLKNLNLPMFRSDADLIQKLWEPLEVERRLLQVLDKQETYWWLVRAAYPDLKRETQWKSLLTDANLLQKELKSEIISAISSDVKSSDVIVDNDKLLHCMFCPECNPAIWDKIIAKSGRDWIKIHTLKCKALKTLSYSSLLEAHRKESETSTNYVLNIQLRFSPKKLSIIDIIALFSTFSIPIFKFELWKEEWKTIANIQWDISNPAKIWFLLADIRQNHPWIEIVRKDLQ